MFYCFHKVFDHFLNVCSVCDCLTKRKKKMNYIFLEPGICRIAYRHTEVWHTCLFIDVSSGQIYFVKHSRGGKITKHREKTVWKILFKTAAEFFCKLNNSHRHLKYKVCHSFSWRRLIFPTAPAWCTVYFSSSSSSTGFPLKGHRHKEFDNSWPWEVKKKKKDIHHLWPLPYNTLSQKLRKQTNKQKKNPHSARVLWKCSSCNRVMLLTGRGAPATPEYRACTLFCTTERHRGRSAREHTHTRTHAGSVHRCMWVNKFTQK